MLDGDGPGRAVRGIAGHPEVAAEVDAGAGRPGGEGVGDHEVGGQALADAAGIEADAGREPDAVAVDLDAGRADGERAGAGAAVEEFEAPVVARPDHRAENGGVETADGDPPRLDGPLHQPAALGRERHPLPRPAGQVADLAVGPEPAPAGLEVVDAVPGPSG